MEVEAEAEALEVALKSTGFYIPSINKNEFMNKLHE